MILVVNFIRNIEVSYENTTRPEVIFLIRTSFVRSDSHSYLVKIARYFTLVDEDKLIVYMVFRTSFRSHSMTFLTIYVSCRCVEFNQARTATPWNPTFGYPVFHNYKIT